MSNGDADCQSVIPPERVGGRAIRICVIGGGAAGLATLKVLQDADEYRANIWELVAFETRSELGGVWLPSPPVGNPPASPMYEGLTTNIPHPVMAYSSFSFKPGTPLFPPAPVVLKYLQDYAAHFNLTKYIRFNTRVENAYWNGHCWNVRLEGSGVVHQFDKIVVANGHYGVPRYPSTIKLPELLGSRRASHSVFYRNPEPYQGLTVLVVGNGPSGQDISADVSRVATTVYRSISGGTPQDVGNVKMRGRVSRFEDDGTVTFEDDSTSAVIDHTIFATGYCMSFPFLSQIRQGSMPAVASSLPAHALNTTYGVFPLARHIFPLQADFPVGALAFVGLPIKVAPFPLFEAQVMMIAKVFAQPGSLDEAEESSRVLARQAQLSERCGGDTATIARWFHKYAGMEQFEYRSELLDFVGAPRDLYPEDWVMDAYNAKRELRMAWVELERDGQAEEWVRGVGQGGKHEWAAMMRRLLEVSAKE